MTTTTTKPFWIGTEYDVFTVGQVGFLVEISHTMKGWTRRELRDHPARTNQSCEARLYGWCGTTNDIYVHAQGMARVEKVARNGRALVRLLDGDEMMAALSDLGYPDLIN